MRLSQYRVLGKVGCGQFGQVFSAIDTKTGQMYALKYLPRGQSSTHRFLRELRYLVTLKHPRIVTCHSILYDTTERYLVLNYCEGGTLHDYLSKNEQISVPVALGFVRDVLLSLQEVHSKGIIHCDIKAQNILLTLNKQGWSACLADFGIARALDEINSYTVGRGYTGSPAYMAPERFYGKYSVASDIYSVGILLYELLVGHRPFSGTPNHLAIAHLNQPISIPVAVPSSLHPILSQALAKLPQRRFTSAFQMAQALQKASHKIALSLPPSIPQVYPVAKAIKEVKLTASLNNLYVNNHSIYCVEHYLLTRYDHNFIQQEKHTFDSHIYALLLGNNKTYIITSTQSNIPPLISMVSEDISLFSLENSILLSAISPDGAWITLYSNPISVMETGGSILSSWQNNQFKQLFLSDLATDLILFNQRHGCLIYLETESTHFKLFNRHGNIFYTFSIPRKLTCFTSSLSDYGFIAVEQEQPNQVLLISLKPFTIKQINLAIQPAVILVQSWGYLLVDKEGKCILLDRDGYLLSRLSISEKFLKIAFLSDSTLLVLQQNQLIWLDLSPFLSRSQA